MCGLAGTYALNGGPVSQEVLLSMAGGLRHRGPDETPPLSVPLLRNGQHTPCDQRSRTWFATLGSEDGRVGVMQSGEIFVGRSDDIIKSAGQKVDPSRSRMPFTPSRECERRP
jgi:hypothetical protein